MESAALQEEVWLMAKIEFRQVCKSFDHVNVIENLNLTIEDGSFTVLVGPSGCGKTTLLRMIAGIGPATSGQVIMDGRDITDLAPGKRDVAMVFQNYAIYPTMTVRGTIEFGLKNRHVPREERDRLIAEVSRSVGLEDYLTRKPSTLSGGQRQRIALARAMVKTPRVFLMDEPLSNLDAKLRVAMRTELIELHRRLGATFIYVTHDQVEAMAMADRIVLMDRGRIQQQASPEELYRDPNNVFTARFIGTPQMNILPLRGGEQLGFRPERCLLLRERPEDAALALPGEVATREMLGSETHYMVRAGEQAVMVKSPDDSAQVGERVWLGVWEKDMYFFDSAGERIRGADERRRAELMNAVGEVGAC